jgi:H+-translocating diphosphatase
MYIKTNVYIAIPEVFVGGLLGSMLISVSWMGCSAVGRTAQEVVNEVRRQFIEWPGIMVSTRSYAVFSCLICI